MCQICEAQKKYPEIDFSAMSTILAIKLFGLEETIENLRNRPEDTPEKAQADAIAFANRVIEGLEKLEQAEDEDDSEISIKVISLADLFADSEQAPTYSRKAESTQPTTAPDFLVQAKKHMDDRAATYDKPEGERSMANTVEAFNTITGHELSEKDGWLLMSILKMVRANQGEFKQDNYEDLVAYTALLAESAVAEQH